jgi:Raf kinase inhibitor-like YbhB/YbcL family protein
MILKKEEVMNYKIVCVVFVIFSLLFVSHVAGKEGFKKDTLKVLSPVFEHNGTIPSKYTCNGLNVNPPILIKYVPEGTKSLALIVDDPDAPAGIWVHWVLWNIHPGTKELREDAVPKGAQQGMNDFRKRSYDGPCPPSGTHRYFFRLYALDTTLTLRPDATKADLEKAMKGHIIEKAHIIGLNKRK